MSRASKLACASACAAATLRGSSDSAFRASDRATAARPISAWSKARPARMQETRGIGAETTYAPSPRVVVPAPSDYTFNNTAARRSASASASFGVFFPVYASSSSSAISFAPSV